MKNPRTFRLKALISGKPLRLMSADRAFLRDLSVVDIIDTATADKRHYSHLQNGSERSLNRLEKAGILESKIVRAKGLSVRTYQFSSREMARAFGGKLPVTGAKRTDLHELITSRMYFELDAPTDFRLANRFSNSDIAICGNIKPDAMYTKSTGEVVFVEADSGHYSKTQIRHKQSAWTDVAQVWGQPEHYAFAVIPQGENITLLRV